MKAPKESYPLCWPDGWKRTTLTMNARFKNNTLGRCCDEALREVQRLGGKSIVISSNIKPRLDGRPYANQGPPSDPGVALYFTLNSIPVALACDCWRTVEDNLWAIVKDIQATRGKIRWGVGSIERAFAGYASIPEKTGGISWWEVLDVPINANAEQIASAYRVKAKIFHPDSGSAPNNEAMVRLNAANEMATNHKSG